MEYLNGQRITDNMYIIDTEQHRTNVNGNTKTLYIIILKLGNDYERIFKTWEYASGNSRDLRYYCIKAVKEAFRITGEGYREYEIMMDCESIYRLRDTDLIVFNKNTTTGSNDLCIYDYKNRKWVN